MSSTSLPSTTSSPPPQFSQSNGVVFNLKMDESTDGGDEATEIIIHSLDMKNYLSLPVESIVHEAKAAITGIQQLLSRVQSDGKMSSQSVSFDMMSPNSSLDLSWNREDSSLTVSMSIYGVVSNWKVDRINRDILIGDLQFLIYRLALLL